MKRMLFFLLAIVMVLLLTACGQSEDDALTMYIGLGNTNSTYYEELHEAILENTGIDVQYVFTNTLDTTSAIAERLEHGDLPADIVITAKPTDEEVQKEVFLDLAAYTNIPDAFTTTKLQELDVDGAVYQLPFTSRLIGVEYNKTLLEEMGWTLPSNFEEMVALKEEVEAAGYTFAVTGDCATGHGFNYLFHLMGTQFIASPDGSQWFRAYRQGTATIDQFAEEADYFQRYVDAGLFGTIYNEDWSAGIYFCRQRALFYYDNLNSVYSYDGYRYNPDGTIYGAEYNPDGTPVAVANPEGEAVLLDGDYVYYDPDNEDHAGLDRYTIPGAVVLHDEYGSMPWISEDGSSNFFAMYDSMYLALDKALGEKANADKLEQAVTVLSFMTTKTATDLFSNMFPDGYVATSDYIIDDSRLYSEYAEHVKAGYLMPWYYADFDDDTIVNTGEKVNNYLTGTEGIGSSEVLEELDRRNSEYVNGEVDILTTVTEELGYEDNARMQAIASGLSLQAVLDEAGVNETVTVGLMPYETDISDIPVSVRLGVVQGKVYAGELPTVLLNSLIGTGATAPVGIRMTGAEIKELVKNGYNSLADYDLDHTFDYACVVRGGEELEDTTEYIVAVSAKSLETAVYEQLEAEGRILTDGETPYTGSTVDGLSLFLTGRETLSPEDLVWE